LKEEVTSAGTEGAGHGKSSGPQGARETCGRRRGIQTSRVKEGQKRNFPRTRAEGVQKREGEIYLGCTGTLGKVWKNNLKKEKKGAFHGRKEENGLQWGEHPMIFEEMEKIFKNGTNTI